MFSIQKCGVPLNSLLEIYSASGCYTDCYCTEVAEEVTFPEFVTAFYTTPLFKVERWILKWTISRPSTDAEVTDLANSNTDIFAAWHIEARNDHELLLCDLNGRTRSWLMNVVVDHTRTRLYFGSAVVPVRDPKTAGRALGFIYRSLLGFHQVYSTLLLYSAKLQIERKSSATRHQ